MMDSVFWCFVSEFYMLMLLVFPIVPEMLIVLWKVILFLGLLFLFSVHLVVKLIGTLVDDADVGHLAIFSGIFL